jgi:PAS domain S-box-containing protein
LRGLSGLHNKEDRDITRVIPVYTDPDRAREKKPTDHNRISDELRKSEIRWRSLVELAPDGIVTISIGGFVTSINTAFSKLTGFSKDDIIGKHFTKIATIRARDIPRYIKMYSSLLRGKAPEPTEFKYLRNDGSLGWAEARYQLIKIGQKKEIIAILRDITQHKLDEEILKRSLEELERSNRELDDYTYAVSHDLKAPLRTIEAFSNFLLEDYAEKLDETGEDYLKRMSEATVRMKNLIDDLLLISRVGRKHTELKMVDLNDVIKEIKLEYESVLKKSQGNIMSEKLPTLKTYKVWIKQLFSNLINNGLKFNRSPDPKVWLSYEERFNEYVFSVRDNGIGIDNKYHEKIFNIFQRLHNQDEYPGTGAGLTICKKIVDSFGGKIWVESKPGKGSTFYFTHPKDVSDRVDESEAHSEVDETMIQVEEDIPIDVK